MTNKTVDLSTVVILVQDAMIKDTDITEDAIVEHLMHSLEIGALFAVKLYAKAKKELGLTTKRLGFKDKAYEYIFENELLTDKDITDFINLEGSPNDMKHKKYYTDVNDLAKRIRKEMESEE